MISNEYKALLEQKQEDGNWGVRGDSRLGLISDYLAGFKAKTVLDYGCGNGALVAALSASYEAIGYDPGRPMFREVPKKPVDVVVCIDVLEHIEPEYLYDVLDHICSLAKKGIYLLIDTKKAGAILPDGRNAHLIIEGLEWWSARLEPFFPEHNIERTGKHLVVKWRR